MLTAASADGHVCHWDVARGLEFEQDRRRRGDLAWAYYDRAAAAFGDVRTGAFRKVLETAPEALAYRQLRGEAAAQLGQFEQAAEEFDELARQNPGYAYVAATDHALCLLASGDIDGYRLACAILADDYVAEGVSDYDRVRIALICALGSDSGADVDEILPRFGIDEVLSPIDADAAKHDYLLARAAAAYRQRRWNESVQVVERLVDELGAGGDATDVCKLACAQYLMAMARYQLGHHAPARRLRRTAEETAEAASNLLRDWRPRAELAILRREAKGTIGIAGN
jgi:tetratricopeptide (TPR) repeat protein